VVVNGLLGVFDSETSIVGMNDNDGNANAVWFRRF